MKNNLKIILGVVLIVALGVGGWFIYMTYGPKLSMEDVVPSKALVYGQLKNPITYWDNFEKSEFYKSLSSIDMPDVLRRNNVPQKKADQYQKSYQEILAILKNPMVGKLLGKEVAFAVYPTKDPKAGVMLVTRSSTSIQVAANLSLFLKDLGEDIEVKKDVVDGHVVMHLVFKKKKVAFKYAHIQDLLVFTDENSALINDVIQTVARKRPSIKADEQFKDLSANFYPNAQGTLYVDIKGVLAANEGWSTLSKPIGFNAYGVSFLPGATTRYKFLVTYDDQKIDPMAKKLLSCAPVDQNALSLVPPLSIAYHWGGCYQFADIATQIRDQAQKALEGQPKRIRKSLQKKISSQETTDFISLLGQEAGFYITDVDTQGMFPYPRVLLFLKMTDPMRAKSLLEESITAKNAFSLIAQEDYNGNNIHFIALPLGGNMDPAFAFQGNYFLLASSRQLIKKSMDSYKDPSKSLLEDKTFKTLDFNTGTKAQGIFYFNVKAMASRMLGVLDWYDRYMSNQVELAATFKREAALKKKQLAEDLISQKQEIDLAKAKMKEWQEKPIEGLGPDELALNADTIKNFEAQIEQVQTVIKDNIAQVKEIDQAITKNASQVENYRKIMYNGSHVLAPLFKGFQSLNAGGIKFYTLPNTVAAEFMLN